MRITKILPSNWFFGTIFVLLSSVAPLFGQAGQNAVINLSGSKVNSIAFIDASNYQTTQHDICITIQTILANNASSNGITVDARGTWLSGNLTCLSSGENPWPASPPTSNVVLLPAGTITISNTWTLPQNTRLIGEGPNTTILQASNFSGSDMIDMGLVGGNCGTGNDCQGIVIEHLGLNAGGINNLNGIVNLLGEELTYVDDLALTGFAGTGTGLTLGSYSGTGGGAATNSGPYSNIYFYSGGGTCLSIYGTNATRGIHGLTCITTSPTSGPLVYIDAPNNSLEDVMLAYVASNDSPPAASLDGILIGSRTGAGLLGAQSNVLTNITGGSLANVVHISAAQSSASLCPPGTGSTSTYNVCDLTILGVTGGGEQVTIKDDITGTGLTDATVGMYALGEQVVQGAGNSLIGYSRMTSSPSVPTWLVGTVAPPAGTGACATGALYSCTGSNSACTNSAPVEATIWGCAGTAWVKIK